MNEIKFDGLEEVLGSIDKINDVAKVEAALGRACALLEGAAKEKAPKGSGELRRSITSKVNGLEGVVFTPLYYAPYVEYGTGLYAENGGRQEVPWVYVEGSGDGGSGKKTVYRSREDAEAAVAYLKEKGLDAKLTYGQHPHPFMRPALNENREKILEILREGLLND